MTQLDIFFNTIGLDEKESEKRELKAGTQNRIILDYFTARPDRTYTPSEVHQNCTELWQVPLTSVRRTISTLTDLGYLEKTNQRRVGEYGEMNYCWRLK